MITGPFDSVRALADDAPVKVEEHGEDPGPQVRGAPGHVMTQFLEAVQIALGAIWASKLRSFLTVLGNIVAVTSVIAVWSLVKGMDTSVTNAILSEFSADSFSVDRRGIITNEDEWEATRNNPRVTMKDAEAIRRLTTSGQQRHGHVVRQRRRCATAST